MPEKYKPIDCNFYDRLEAAATQRRPVLIKYFGNNGTEEVAGIILDLRIVDEAEWLYLDTGFSLRLDKLISVDGELMPGQC